MSAAASTQRQTRVNNTTSQKLFYRYLKDKSLYELLARIVNKDLDRDIRNELPEEQRGMHTHSSIHIGRTGFNKDPYIYIGIFKNNVEIGHITFHLLPFDTRQNTIGPLHIRNQYFDQKVSRIGVEGSPPGIFTPREIKLHKGSPPTNRKNIDTDLQAVSETVFSVLNTYFAIHHPRSITSYPRYTTQQIIPRLIDIIELVTTGDPSDTRRIRRTPFAETTLQLRGGGQQTKRSHRGTKDGENRRRTRRRMASEK
jgi:hypothetical protein